MQRLVCFLAVLLLPACASLGAGAPLRVTTGDVKPMAGGPNVSVPVTLGNHGRRPSGRVIVACNYFDAAGTRVGSGLVYFNKVAAGADETILQMVVVPGVARGDCGVR